MTHNDNNNNNDKNNSFNKNYNNSTINKVLACVSSSNKITIGFLKIMQIASPKE